jgi:hypothetical protein
LSACHCLPNAIVGGQGGLCELFSEIPLQKAPNYGRMGLSLDERRPMRLTESGRDPPRAGETEGTRQRQALKRYSQARRAGACPLFKGSKTGSSSFKRALSAADLNQSRCLTPQALWSGATRFPGYPNEASGRQVGPKWRSKRLIKTQSAIGKRRQPFTCLRRPEDGKRRQPEANNAAAAPLRGGKRAQERKRPWGRRKSLLRLHSAKE